MKKAPVSLICGIAAILATILLYFALLGNAVLQAIHFMSLAAIVLAEILTTGYAMLSGGRPRRVAAAFVSALLIPIAILLSLVYILSFPQGYLAYLGLYSVALVIINAIALILISFDSRKTEEDTSLQAAKGNMLYMRKLVLSILADPNAAPYSQRLYALEESLHFTNDSVIVPEDGEICRMLDHLQANLGTPGFDAEALLSQLERTLRQRTVMTSRNA